MLFVFHGLDRPHSADLRAAERPAHLAHLEAHRHHIVLAGPLIGADGAMMGSLLILDFPDRPALDSFLAGDPYAKAGLFGEVRISTFRRVIG